MTSFPGQGGPSGSGGAGNGAGVKSYLSAILGATQTPLVGDTPIDFDTVDKSRGTDITLNIATGIFTLKAGKTYKCFCSFRNSSVSSPLPIVNCRWRDVTNNTVFGSGATAVLATHTGNRGSQNITSGIITPVTDIDVEVRIEASSQSLNLAEMTAGFTNALIEEF